MIVTLHNSKMDRAEIEVRPMETPGKFVLEIRPKYAMGLCIMDLTAVDLHDLADAIDAALAPKPVEPTDADLLRELGCLPHNGDAGTPFDPPAHVMAS